MSYSELIDELTNMAIKKLDPEERESRKQITQNKSLKTSTSAVEQQYKQNSRYIPSVIKRAVWQRDKGRCVFKESENHSPCGSKLQLEYHHEIPSANGGQSNLENIKLNCKRHNVHQTNFK